MNISANICRKFWGKSEIFGFRNSQVSINPPQKSENIFLVYHIDTWGPWGGPMFKAPLENLGASRVEGKSQAALKNMCLKKHQTAE